MKKNLEIQQMSSYLYDMNGEKKKTFTYATHPTIVDKARKKAFKEGLTVSEKIDELLRDYVGAVKKIRNENKGTNT